MINTGLSVNFSNRQGNKKSSQGANIYWCDCQLERVGEGDKGFGKQHKIVQTHFYFNATLTWSKLNATTVPFLYGIGKTLTSFQESFSILICFCHDKTGMQRI